MKRRYTGSLLFSLFLIGLTFFVLLRGGELRQLPEALRGASLPPLLAGLCLMLLFVGCEALAVYLLLRSFSARPAFRQCLRYSFLGFFYCSVTPSASGGQPMQVYYMSRDGLEAGPSALCILVVTASYQAGILLLGAAAWLLRGPLLAENLGPARYFALYGALVNLLLVLLLTLAAVRADVLRRIFSACVRALTRLKWMKHAGAALQGAERQLKEYEAGAAAVRRRPRVLLAVFAAILCQILCRLSVAWAVYRAFGLSGYSYPDMLALQIMLALAVESLPLPGAVGAAEMGFLSVNRAVFGGGKLMPAMLLSRGISFYAMLLLSAAVALRAHLTGRRG